MFFRDGDYKEFLKNKCEIEIRKKEKVSFSFFMLCLTIATPIVLWGEENILMACIAALAIISYILIRNGIRRYRRWLFYKNEKRVRFSE